MDYGYMYGTYYGTKNGLLKNTNSLKNLNGPSMCEKIMDKLRYLVFNNKDLLALTFETEEECQQYYDDMFVDDMEALEAEKKKNHIAMHSDF